MKGQPQRDLAARRYWLEVTTGDLHGPRVEGPYFASVEAGIQYVRRLSKQIEPQRLASLLWADVLVFHVVAESPDGQVERVWFGAWDVRRHMIVPHAARAPGAHRASLDPTACSSGRRRTPRPFARTYPRGRAAATPPGTP